MIKKNNNKNYSSFAKVLHWGFIILFIYGIAKQVNDLKQLEDIDFFRFEIIFALLFLIILLIRLIYMKTTQKTSLPDDTPKVQKMTAKVVHNGMYILLFGTVLSGLLIGFVYWLGFKDGSLVEIIISLHEIIINLLYFLIVIHIIAAIYHRFKKDGVWNSMTPFFKVKE